jgi:hypothetical protein
VEKDGYLFPWHSMHSPPRPVLVKSTSLKRQRVEKPLQSHAKQQ